MDVDAVTQRPLRYWFVDGVPELTMGTTTVLFGVLFIMLSQFSGGVAGSVSVGLLVCSLALARAMRRMLPAIKARTTFPRTGYIALPRRQNRRQAITLVALMLGIMLVVLLVPLPDLTRILVFYALLLTFVLNAIWGRWGDNTVPFMQQIALLFGTFAVAALVLVSVAPLVPERTLLAASTTIIAWLVLGTTYIRLSLRTGLLRHKALAACAFVFGIATTVACVALSPTLVSARTSIGVYLTLMGVINLMLGGWTLTMYLRHTPLPTEGT